ncbi:hypothetical protein D3C86_2197550 [compost metagenome]
MRGTWVLLLGLEGLDLDEGSNVIGGIVGVDLERHPIARRIEDLPEDVLALAEGEHLDGFTLVDAIPDELRPLAQAVAG